MQDPANPELRQPDASVAELRAQVEAIAEERALLQKGHARAVREVVFRLDQGELRVAERTDGPDRWLVHGWIQQSISFYFAIAHSEAYQAGDLEFHDKVPPKHGLAAAGIRVVPPGVVLTASTPIYDVTGREERAWKGRVPARSVVIPGMRPRKFPAGEYLTPCALIIGQRNESTDKKTSLNQALRDFGVSV